MGIFYYRGVEYVLIRALYRDGDRWKSRRYPYGFVQGKQKLSRQGFFLPTFDLFVQIFIYDGLHFVKSSYHIARKHQMAFRARQILPQIMDFEIYVAV